MKRNQTLYSEVDEDRKIALGLPSERLLGHWGFEVCILLSIEQ
jgi:hypothetical protein